MVSMHWISTNIFNKNLTKFLHLNLDREIFICDCIGYASTVMLMDGSCHSHTIVIFRGVRAGDRLQKEFGYGATLLS